MGHGPWQVRVGLSISCRLHYHLIAGASARMTTRSTLGPSLLCLPPPHSYLLSCTPVRAQAWSKLICVREAVRCWDRSLSRPRSPTTYYHNHQRSYMIVLCTQYSHLAKPKTKPGVWLVRVRQSKLGLLGFRVDWSQGLDVHSLALPRTRHSTSNQRGTHVVATTNE